MRVFIKFLKQTFLWLRDQYFNLAVYVHDILIAGDSRRQSCSYLHAAMLTLQNLGCTKRIYINPRNNILMSKNI